MNAPVLLAQLAGSSAQVPAAPKNLKIEKPQNGQAVTVQLDGATKLDLAGIASEKLTFVRVGERLVILFDNQSTVTVDPVFDNNGRPLTDLAFDMGADRTLSNEQFAQTFPITTDQSVLPAAGGASGPTGGANFADASVQTLGASGGRLGLLGNEDGAGAAASENQPLANPTPIPGGVTAVTLNEDGFAEGNPGGDGDVGGLATSVINGSLNVDFGTDLSNRSFEFATTQDGLAGLTSGGQLVQLFFTTVNGLPTLIGYVGSDPNLAANQVFTVSLDADTTINGQYNFTLLRPLDHSERGSIEETLNLTIAVIARDGSGDAVDVQIPIAINDDTPVISGTINSSVTDPLVAADPAVQTGALGISWGADRFNDTIDGGVSNTTGGNGDRAVIFTNASVGATGSAGAIATLTSNGVAVSYALLNNGTTLVAYTGATVPTLTGEIGDNVVFVVRLSDVGNGSYTITQYQPLDHISGEQNLATLNLSFQFTATDSDGDPVSGSFTVQVVDTSPTAGAEVAAQDVGEDGLSDANTTGGGYDAIDDNALSNISLNINWGADDDTRGAGDSFGRTLAFVTGDNAQSPALAIAGADGEALTSGGVALQYVITQNVNGGQTLTAYKGAPGEGNAVFTLTLDPTAPNGSYSFTLLGELDHAPDSNSIGLTFTVRAADADGDAVNVNFAINVQDDVPTVGEPVGEQTVGEDGLSGANLEGETSDIKVLTNVALNINWGADNDMRGESDTYGRTLKFGSVDQPVSDPEGEIPALVMVDPGPAAPSWLTVTGADGTALTSGGVVLQYVVVDNDNGGQTLTAYKGAAGEGNAVFTLTLDPTKPTGSYSFELIGELDHAPNSDNIALAFAVHATDADGDTANTGFTINVGDDAPIFASPIATQSVDEEGNVGDSYPQNGAGTAGDLPGNAKTASASLNISWGADDGNSVTDGGFDGTQVKGDRSVVFASDAVSALEAQSFTSNGVALQYVLSDNGATLTAYQGSDRGGGDRVFTIKLSDTGSGSYSFELFGRLDHPVANTEDDLTAVFKFIARDADGDSITSEFSVTVDDDAPIFTSAIATQSVDEEGNAGDTYPQNGNGTAGDLPGAAKTATASLNISWGADDGNKVENGGFNGTQVKGDRSVVFANDAMSALVNQGFTSNGVALQYVLSDNGTTLTAYQGSDRGGGDRVFTIKLSDTGSGSYSFELFGRLDHPVANTEDDLTAVFKFTARDADGDSITSEFSVTIDDDAPIFISAIATQSVDEEGNAGDTYPQNGNGTAGDLPGAAKTATASLNISWGADDGNKAENGGFNGTQVKGDRSVAFASDATSALVAQNFKSDGVALQYVVTNNGTTLTAYEGNGRSPSDKVFTVQLSDQGNGSYTFTLHGHLDHPVANMEDDLTALFKFIARDADGDSIVSSFSVAINDDAPIFTAAADTGYVDEERIPSIGGNLGGTGDMDGVGYDTSGDLHISWGADDRNGSGSIDRDVRFNGYAANSARPTLTVGSDNGPLTLTSDGRTVYVWTSADGHTLYGYVGNAPSGNNAPSFDNRVFTVTLSDNGGGSYSFTLHDNLDHPTANTEDNLTLTFNFAARDADGDTITSTFSIVVDDDTPVIGNPTDETVNEDDLANGNDFPPGESLVQSGGLAISWGADDNNSGVANRKVDFTTASAPSGLTSDGVEIVYTISNGGTLLTATKGPNGATVFTVQLSDDFSGSYTFRLYGNLDHAPSGPNNDSLALTFGFRATDSDGDTATSSFKVTVIDDQPLIGSPENEAVNEDDLSNGNDPAPKDSLIQSGDLDIFWGADDNNTGSANRKVEFTTTSAPSGLSSDGVAIVYTVSNGGTLLTATKGANGPTVFTIQLSDESSGEYTFRLYGNIDHAISGPNDDQLTLTFGFRATDSDGDSASSNFKVSIVDDEPVTFGAVATRFAGEDGLAGANQSGGSYDAANNASIAGAELNIRWGADDDIRGAGDNFGRTLSFLTSGGSVISGGGNTVSNLGLDVSGENGSTLRSGGVALQYVVTTTADGGAILTAYKGSPTNGVKVFTLALDATAEHGAYTFNLLGELDHASNSNVIGLTFSVQASDADGDKVNTGFTVNVQDDVPTTTGSVGAQNVGEDGLSGANPTGGSYEAVNNVGLSNVALNINWGADNDTRGNNDGYGRTLSFNMSNGKPVNAQGNALSLTSDGTSLSYVVNTLSNGGQELIAYKTGTNPNNSSNHVFKVTLDPTSEHGSYSFTLLGNLDHTGNGNNDVLALNFGLTAADADGDTVGTNFTVNVQDDVPLAATGEGVSLTEDDISTYPATDATSADVTSKSGDLNISWGADNSSARSVGFTSATAATNVHVSGAFQDTVLTSDGLTVKYAIVGGVLYGYTGNTNGQNPPSGQVFKVSLDDSGSGSYTFTLLGNLDHASGSGENNLTLRFDYTAKDSDGDSASNTFTVTIKDDQPVIGTPDSKTVIESTINTSQSNAFLSASATGSLAVNWGADDANTNSGANDRSLQFAAALNNYASGLTSNGEAITYTLSNNGTLLTATASSGGQFPMLRTVFTVSLNDATGEFTFTLLDNLDHTAPASPGAVKNDLSISFDFVATDSDGDTASKSFTVKVTDDIPVVLGNATAGSIDEVELTTGQVINTTTSGSLKIDWNGDDQKVHLEFATTAIKDGNGNALSLKSDGVALDYVVRLASNGHDQELVAFKLGDPLGVDNPVFIVALNGPGNAAYAITLYQNLDHPGTGADTLSLNFTVRAFDGDGDSVVQTFAVNIVDSVPTAGTQVAATLDDDALAGGNDGGVGDDNGAASTTGGLIHDYKADEGGTTLLTGAGLPSTSSAEGSFSQTLSSDGRTLTIQQIQFGAVVTVITVQLTDSTSGAYTVTLNHNILHLPGGDENNATFTINYQVKDSDGDIAPGTLSLNVDDDTPVIAGNAPGSNQILNGQFLDNTGFGAPMGWGGEAATGAIQGWVISGAALERNPSGWYVTDPVNGGRVVDLDASPGNVTLTQSLTNLTAGQSYTLSFDAAKPAGFSAKAEVWWNGQLVGSVDPTSSFQQFSYTFTAVAGTNTLEFREVGIADNGGTFLANVQLHTSSSFVDDDAQSGGNAGGISDVANGNSASGAAGALFSIGADGLKSVALDATTPFKAIYKDVSGVPHQESVTWGQPVVVDGATTWTATGDTSHGTVATLTINAEGSYTFTVLKPLVHPTSSTSEENLSLTFSYTVTDGDDDTASGSLTLHVNDDTPTIPATQTQRAGVHDDALAGGNPEAGDTTTASGVLSHSVGADGGTLAWITPTLPTGGYTFNVNGTTMEVFQSQNGSPVKVFTVSLDAVTGAYTVKLLAAVIHPSGAGDLGEGFNLNYRVTDGDGDYVDSYLRVVVGDDVPVSAGAVNATTVLDDDALSGGNAGGIDDVADAATASGGAGALFSIGADGLKSVALNATTPFKAIYMVGGVAHQESVSWGQPTVVGGATTWTATGDISHGNVATLTINADGSYTFKMLKPLVHPTSDVSEENLSLTFNYTVTDGDNDTATGSLTVQVNDDTPTKPQAYRYNDINEADLANGPASGAYTYTINFGADGYGATAFTGAVKLDIGPGLPGNESFDLTAGAYRSTKFTSDGRAITFKLEADGTIRGYVTDADNNGGGDVTILQLKLTGTNVTTTLYGSLDHIAAQDGSPIASLVVDATVRFTDGDGDSVTSIIRNTFHDGSPSAGDQVATAATTAYEDGARIFSAGLNINWGADDANPTPGAGTHDRSIAFLSTATTLAGSSAMSALTSYGQAVNLAYLDAAHMILVGYTGNTAPTDLNATNLIFVVTLNDAGTYNFDLRGPIDHPAPNGQNQQFVDIGFSYQVTDSDGDADPGTFAVRIDAAGTIGSIHYDALTTGVFVNLADVATTLNGQTVAANTATDLTSGGGHVVGNDAMGTISEAHGSKANDILVGGDEDNVLYGNDGDDTLSGGLGTDRLSGGAGNDTFLLGKDVTGSGTRTFQLGDGSTIEVNIDGLAGTMDPVDGGSGYDKIILNKGSASGYVYDAYRAPSYISGIEEIVGTDGDDVIMVSSSYRSDAANSGIKIDGGKGRDYLGGGAGDDTIDGGDGDDVISGLGGDDVLNGGNGTDTIYGGDGKDTIRGGSGNDKLFGDAGEDLIYGGEGADEIHGGADNDVLHGEGGDDTIYGDGGNDTVYGGDGKDTIYGGAGNDSLYGQGGNDTITGGLGDDTIGGGDGDDRILHTVGDGNDFVDGGAGNDTLVVTGDAVRRDFVIGKYPTWSPGEVQGTPTDKLDLKITYTGVNTADIEGTIRADSVEDIVLDIDTGNNTVTVGDLTGTGIASTTVVINSGSGDSIFDLRNLAGTVVDIRDTDSVLSGDTDTVKLAGRWIDYTFTASGDTYTITRNIDNVVLARVTNVEEFFFQGENGGNGATIPLSQVVNVGPVANGDTGEVTEDAATTPSTNDRSVVSGDVLQNDTDANPLDVLKVSAVKVGNVTTSVTADGVTVTGTYGTLLIKADGSFTYTLNDTDPDTNALVQGQQVTESFTYTVKDAAGLASNAAIEIAITGTNDTPVLTVAGSTVGYVEADGPDTYGTFVFAGLTTSVSDADAGASFSKVTIKITNAQSGDDLNMFTTPSQRKLSDGTLINYIKTSAAGEFTMTFTNAASGQTLTSAQVDEAIRTLVRFHTGDRVASDTPDRLIDITVYDDTGAASNVVRLTLDVQGTNDTPEWANASLNTSVNEDGSFYLGGKFTSAQLKVSDADGEGNAKLILHVDHGKLSFASVAGVSVVEDTATNTYTLTGTMTQLNNLLTLANGVKYTPNADYNGVDELKLTFSDNGDYGLPAKQAEATIAITVNAVNDVPVISSADAGITVFEAGGLNNVRTADVGPNFSFEPNKNIDTVVNGYASIDTVAGMQALVQSAKTALGTGATLADAFASVWDYLDDARLSIPDVNQAYYATLINKATVLLGIAYADYLRDGGRPLLDVVVKFQPDNNGDSVPQRSQSLHDNLLGAVHKESVIDKFANTGLLPQMQDMIEQAGLTERPIFGGYQGDTNASLSWDQQHGLVSVATGQFAATDVDGDTLVWSIAGPDTYGTMSIDAATGKWIYTLDNSKAATQALAEGQIVTQSYTATVSDGHGGADTVTVTVTIHGTNDAAVIGTPTVSSMTEDLNVVGGYLKSTGTISLSDVDSQATFQPTVTPVGTVLGSLVLAADGSYTYSVANNLVQYLGAGQTKVETFTITSADGTTKNVSFTINGANDLMSNSIGFPDEGTMTEYAETDSQANTNIDRTRFNDHSYGGGYNGGGFHFYDRDVETHTVTVTEASGNQTHIGYVTAVIAQETSVTASGFVNWNYHVTDAQLNFLGAGETLVQKYTVTVDDGHGSSTSREITITLVGTNDKPVITIDGGDSTAATLTETNAGQTASGTMSVKDVDLVDAVTATVTAVTATGLGSHVSNSDLLSFMSVTSGDLTAAGSATGDLNWSFNSANHAFDYLPDGAEATLRYTIQVSDGHGGTASQVVEITIKGTNDGPQANPDTLTIAEDSGPVVFNVIDNDVDVDGPRPEFSGVELKTIGAGTVVDSGGGNITFTPAENFNGTAVIEYRIVDDHGVYSTSTLTINVTPVNDAPVLSDMGNTVSYTENSLAVVIDSTITIADVDDTNIEGATVKITSNFAAGQDVLAFTNENGITGSWDASTGTLTLVGSATRAQYEAALESITYKNTSEAPSTAPRTISFTVTDGDLTSNVGTATVNVIAVNDAPVIVSHTAGAGAGEDAAMYPPVKYVGSMAFSDPDGGLPVGQLLGTALSVSSGSLTAAQQDAITAALITGKFAFTNVTTDSNGYKLVNWELTAPGAVNLDFLQAGQDLTVTFNMAVSDGTATSGTVSYNLVFTGTNDAPVLTGDLTETVAEGGTYTIVAADLGFSDPDDVASGVTFTASSLNHGMLLVNGVTATTFTGTELAAGQVKFVHDSSEGNSAGFQVKVEDGNEDNSAPVNQAFTFTVTPENDGAASLTVVDSTQTATAPKVGDVLQSTLGADPDGAKTNILYQWLSDGVNIANATGANYTVVAADAGHAISVKVTYTDGQGFAESVTSSPTAAVIAVNNAPLTQSIVATGNEDGALIAIQLSGSDDGTLAGYRIKSLPANGTLYTNANGTGAIVDEQVLSATGTLTVYFKPSPNWSGSTSFEYAARDTTGLEDPTPATATVDVAPVLDSYTLTTVSSTTPVPTGSEFRVNTTTSNDQSEPSVAALSNGGFVVTWRSETSSTSYNIVQQRYGADKNPINGEVIVQTVSGVYASYTAPEVVGLANGGYVVMYDKPYVGEFVRIYDNNGSGGSEIKVNTSNLNVPGSGSITALWGGGFVVTWDNYIYQGDATSDVFGQMYTAAGVKVGGEFRVNSNTSSYQFSTSVGALSDGGFVVAWNSGSGDFTVQAQRYDVNGTKVGSEFQVAAQTSANGDSQNLPSVVGLKGGGFVVTWSADTNFVGDIKGQLYGANGAAIGPKFTVNTTLTGAQLLPDIVALADGGFLITWSSVNGSISNIHGQRFNASGAKVGIEFVIDQTTNDYDTGHAGNLITQLGSGELVTVWTQSPSAGADGEVYARVITLPAGILTAEDTAAALPLNITFTDTDGSEYVSQVVLTGQPAGTTFNIGHVDPSNGAKWIIDNPTAAQLAALTVTGAPNFNGSFTLSAAVTVHDDATLSTGDTSASATSTLTIPVTVTAVNDAPVISSAAAVSVPENSVNAYQIVATDADAGTNLTYSLTGTDAALFNISATGLVTFKNPPNFEAPADNGANNKYDIVVHASDGIVDTVKSVQITVTDVNDAPATAQEPLAVGRGYAVTGANSAYANQVIDIDAIYPSLFADPEGGAVTWSTGTLPTGFSFDPSGKTLAFTTATPAGVYDITLYGSDGVNIASEVIKVWVAGSTSTWSNASGGQGNDTLVNGSSGNNINANGGHDFVDAGGGNDTVNGGDGNDVLYGGSANDILDGGNGNDYLNGGSNDDVINGGDGDDWLVGDSGSDVMTGGLGNDTLIGGTGGDTFNYTIGDGADRVYGGENTDTLAITGTVADDTLNVVVSNGKITQFAGGTVQDVENITLDLGAHGAAGDTLSYAGTAATEAISVDLANAVATGFTSIANVDNVTGGAGNDTLTGNSGANTLIGGAGDDVLVGGKDDVVVRVQATGQDTSSNANYFRFDVIKGGDTDFVDTITINLRAGTDSNAIFDGTASSSRNGDGEWGPSFSNFTGGANEFNFAAENADDTGTMTINPYSQQLKVGQGFNLNIDIDQLGSGSAAEGDAYLLGTVGAQVSVTLEDGGGSGTGTFVANGTAGATTTVTVVRDLADYLDGGAGNDTIYGGGGNDIIIGGTGNDTLWGGTGADKFRFSETGAANLDRILDFSHAEGDSIDLSGLLDGIAGVAANGSNIGSYVQLTQNGSDLSIKVDTSGTGNFSGTTHDVATLVGYGTSNADIVNMVFKNTDHTMTA